MSQGFLGLCIVITPIVNIMGISCLGVNCFLKYQKIGIASILRVNVFIYNFSKKNTNIINSVNLRFVVVEGEKQPIESLQRRSIQEELNPILLPDVPFVINPHLRKFHVIGIFYGNSYLR